MKKLALGIIAATITMSAFAMHGEGFKIIHESHKVTGEGATGHLEQNCGGTPDSKYAHAGVNTYDARGRVRSNIGLQANHFYMVKNETGRSQRYKVHYDIHSIGASNIHDIELELRPGGWVDESAKNFLTVQPTQKGRFEIHASTEVFGESHQKADDGKTLSVN